MFEGIIQIIRELWLECNSDRHRSLQGQQRIAKIIEATQTATDLHSIWSLIMPQYESRYFLLPLEGMLERSTLKMLAWATRWKIGIYQSIRWAKLLSKKMTVPIWKIWESDRTDGPIKKVDKKRITQSKQRNIKQHGLRLNWKLPGVQNQPVELQSTSSKRHIYKLLLMILKWLCWKIMMHYTEMLSVTK